MRSLIEVVTYSQHCPNLSFVFLHLIKWTRNCALSVPSASAVTTAAEGVAAAPKTARASSTKPASAAQTVMPTIAKASFGSALTKSAERARPRTRIRTRLTVATIVRTILHGRWGWDCTAVLVTKVGVAWARIQASIHVALRE